MEIFAFNMWKSSFLMEKYYYLYFHLLNAEIPVVFQCAGECDNRLLNINSSTPDIT